MNNWIDNLQTYTSALEQQIKQLCTRLDAAEKEIAELRDKLSTYTSKEPEIEVELLVAEEEQSLPEILPAEETQMPNSVEKDAEDTPAQPIVVLSDKEAAAHEEAKVAEEVNHPTSETPAPTAEREIRHEEPTIERGSTLAPPVSDIRKAISLGDRFLFQRELFAADGEKMNKTIDTLNKMNSLEEALEYIQKHFNWQEDSPATKLFISILHRRFA